MMMMMMMMVMVVAVPGEEEGQNGFPATSHQTRKSNSFDTGTVRVTLWSQHRR